MESQPKTKNPDGEYLARTSNTETAKQRYESLLVQFQKSQKYEKTMLTRPYFFEYSKSHAETLSKAAESITSLDNYSV